MFLGQACYGAVASERAWAEFGCSVLYFGGHHCPLPTWMLSDNDVKGAFTAPELATAAKKIKLYLERALHDYATDSFVWQGRIPLNKDPRCILGFYLTNTFPESTLGWLGNQEIVNCIRRSCLNVLGVDQQWQQMLEDELTLKTTADGAFSLFNPDEIPFLLSYLVKNGSSDTVRTQALHNLVQYLWKHYGLGSALSRRIMLESLVQSAVNGNQQLKMAQYLEDTGSLCDAQKAYALIVDNVKSQEVVERAAQGLIRLRLTKSEYYSAWEVWEDLKRRFPSTHCVMEELRTIESIASTESELLAHFIKTFMEVETEEMALALYRQSAQLRNSPGGITRWKELMSKTGFECLGQKWIKFLVTEMLVQAGEIEQAISMLDILDDSHYPALRANVLVCRGMIQEYQGDIQGAVVLYQEARCIKRATVIPDWLRVPHFSNEDVESLSPQDLHFAGICLRAYNALLDSHWQQAASCLHQAEKMQVFGTNRDKLVSMQSIVPIMLMLAYAGQDDYVRAEQSAMKALFHLGRNVNNNTASIPLLLEASFKLDEERYRLCCKLHMGSRMSKKVGPLQSSLDCVHKCLTDLDSLTLESSIQGFGLLVRRIKRGRLCRLLMAEYNEAIAHFQNLDEEGFLRLEPVLFSSQLIGGADVESMQNIIIKFTPRQFRHKQMYRFADFARKWGQTHVAYKALDFASSSIPLGEDHALLEIALMYLECDNHQKAVDVYTRIVKQTKDVKLAEETQLKMIDIYKDHLKQYDMAINVCQDFLGRFPKSEKVPDVEYQIGLLAYMNLDYIGATGRLDSFQRKYPNSPNLAQAMMLAGLSQMSDGKTENAVIRFKEIIRKCPDSQLAARSRFLIGYTFMSEQKYTPAMEAYKQLIEQFPDSKYTQQARKFVERLSKVTQ